MRKSYEVTVLFANGEKRAFNSCEFELDETCLIIKKSNKSYVYFTDKLRGYIFANQETNPNNIKAEGNEQEDS